MGHFARFDPLVLTSSSLGLWHLPCNTAKSWKRLEQLLCLVAEKLQSYFTSENPNIPVIWKTPAKPGLYGYFETHATHEAASLAINESIDGFVVYTAHVSFLIVLCQFTASIWQRSSVQDLFTNAKIAIHPKWILAFLDSGIGDFTMMRR